MALARTDERPLYKTPSCRECRTPDAMLIHDHRQGNVVCKRCGLVAERGLIDTHSEWRTFSDSHGDEASRVGGPTNSMFGTGTLSTNIGEGNDPSTRMFHLAGQSSDYRALTRAQTEFNRLGTLMGCSESIKGRALDIFHKVKSQVSLRGRPLEGIHIACFYHSFAEHNVSRSYRELASFCTLSSFEIGRCVKHVQKVADLDNRRRVLAKTLFLVSAINCE
ncbi:hypothetical protein GEMRC1_001719 [Eukaryota sp. GEM-RC1]